jgi:TATA-box binding protein (TBP) (component of TFIID and TFIIIB)
MKINNIVIAGVIKDDTAIDYHRIIKGPPYMKIYKSINNDYTLITFKSGKCRIMGRKIPQQLPFSIKESRIQTMSATHKLLEEINLKETTCYFKQMGYKIEYEPEIFPAMRLLDFNPICVNIFSSGKVTLLGLKSEKQGYDIINKLKQDLSRSSELYK